jgi:predicted Zn-ribbon and HTH transcriptional regulator
LKLLKRLIRCMDCGYPLHAHRSHENQKPPAKACETTQLEIDPPRCTLCGVALTVHDKEHRFRP